MKHVENPAVYLFLFSGMFLAALLRLWNLGELGLWGDEGYTALAVKSILENGYPLLPSGGIYFRSVPFLYLESFGASLLGLNEFALRLPMTIFSLGSCVLAYIIGKHLWGVRVGILAFLLMAFSSWEIEFGRYARMYSMFQFCYLLSVYLFYRGFIEESKVCQIWTIPIWIVTLLIHKLGLTLIPLVFFPLVMARWNRSRMMVLTGLAIGMVGIYFLLQKVEKLLRGTPVIESKVSDGFFSHLPVVLPNIQTFLSVMDGSFISVFYGTLFVGMGIFLIRNFSESEQNTGLKFTLLSIAYLCIWLGQLVLGGLLMMLYLMIFPRSLKEVGTKIHLRYVLGVCATIGFFVIGCLIQDIALVSIVKSMLHYPNIYHRVGKYLIEGWLPELVLAILGAVILWSQYFQGPKEMKKLYVSFAIVSAVCLMGVAKLGDNSARYSFHLFPLLLLCEAFVVVYVIERVFSEKRLVLACAALVVIFLSFPNTIQLSAALEPSFNRYKDGISQPLRTPSFGNQSVYHIDYKGPSLFIKEHRLPGDIILTMDEVIPYYYIGKVDYLWVPKDIERPSQHQFSGTGIVEKLKFGEVKSLVKNQVNRRIWIMDNHLRTQRIRYNTEVLSFLEDVRRCQVYVGEDEHTRVHLIKGGMEKIISCPTYSIDKT